MTPAPRAPGAMAPHSPAAPTPEDPIPPPSATTPTPSGPAAVSSLAGNPGPADIPPAPGGAYPDRRTADDTAAPRPAGDGAPPPCDAACPPSVRGQTAHARATGRRNEAGPSERTRQLASAGGKGRARPQAFDAEDRRTARRRPEDRPAAADPARPTPATADAPGFDPAESPLVWLARRAGKDGRPFVDATQLTAGERLRADFTRAALTPRVTSRWSEVSGAGSPEAFSDMVLAAKLRVSRALAAVGPELSGVLLDVCCFLKGLETVERERGWPARTAKVVLGLALDRLAAHYGLSRTTEGRARAPLRAWHAPPAAPDQPEA